MMPRARVRRTWGWVEACGVAMAAGAAVGAETMHLYRVKLVWTLEQLRAGSSCGQQRKSQ